MMEALEVMRAQEEWQRAGAYSVRIQGMNRQHHISLRDEFDEHDGEGTKYIILLDQGYPIATCRFYEIAEDAVTIGRVVVLPEYREHHLGERVIREAESWIAELGYKKIQVDSRVVAVGFYEKLGYEKISDEVYMSGVFECTKMIKRL
ncbi:MAG: GNAT family N-acetyltransferase [Lachnospiraceae bacterium]|nr:GNAT family N-acetyltransferase [Lachnospiraceae bacterium]